LFCLWRRLISFRLGIQSLLKSLEIVVHQLGLNWAGVLSDQWNFSCHILHYIRGIELIEFLNLTKCEVFLIDGEQRPDDIVESDGLPFDRIGLLVDLSASSGCMESKLSVWF